MASTSSLFELEQAEVEKTSVDITLIFEEIHKEIREYLTEEIDTDLTGGVFDLLKSLTNHLQVDFDKLIGEDNNKKHFVNALTQVFALLLNTKFNTANTNFCIAFKYKSQHGR